MAQEVFISYRSEDRVAAERVCDSLERESIKCWIAPRDIGVGQEWATAIVTALRECSHFVLILSSNSSNAKQISREAELADKQGLPIITFRVEDVEPPPGLIYFLGNLQWLDAFGGRFDSALMRLRGVVRSNGDAGAAPPPVRPESHAAPVERAPSRSILFVLVGVVALAVVAWYFIHSTKRVPTDLQAVKASEFGQVYMKARDSGALDSAYAMLGPAFRSNLDRQRFGSEAEALQTKGKVTHYVSAGACTVRERGAYTCDYRISYSDGRTRDELLVVANRDGNWSIAGDKFGVLR